MDGFFRLEDVRLRICGRYTFFMRGNEPEDRVEDDVGEPAAWRDDDLSSYGGGFDDAEKLSLTTYTILTEQANSAVEDVHDRMPVVLEGDAGGC